MGLFGFLGSDPTRDWPECEPFQPVVDLAQFSLCGVAIGDEAGAIRKLGKPSGRNSFKKEHFRYPESGTVVTTKQGVVDCFFVRLVPNEAGEKGCASMVLQESGGSKLEVSLETTLDEITGLLGPPSKTERDEEEFADLYFLNGCTLEIEATTEGTVVGLILSKDD